MKRFDQLCYSLAGSLCDTSSSSLSSPSQSPASSLPTPFPPLFTHHPTMQISKCFLSTLAILCLSCCIKAYVLPDDIKDGDGFEELCHNSDPASPVNAAECKKVIDETSTAYTGTNYTLPSTTPLSVKNNDVIATTVTPNVSDLTDHRSNKSQRAVQQANSTGGMANSTLMTSTSSLPSSTSTPVPVIVLNDTEVTTKETFVLTADHVASKSQSEVTSSTTVVPVESTSASITPKSGSMAVVTNVALLAVLLALASLLH